LDPGKAPQEELAKAHALLDLPEYRFDHLFPEATGASPATSLQPIAHSCEQASFLAVLGVGRGLGPMLLAACGDLPGGAPL